MYVKILSDNMNLLCFFTKVNVIKDMFYYPVSSKNTLHYSLTLIII